MRFLLLSHLLYGMCAKIFIMNRCILKSYTTTRNTLLLTNIIQSGGNCSVNYYSFFPDELHFTLPPFSFAGHLSEGPIPRKVDDNNNIFTVCMVPFTKILQDAKARYTLGDVKINHLFFMDDLRSMARIKQRLKALYRRYG